MTRLWTDGAEFGDILFWDVSGGFASVGTSHPRSGIYYYDMYHGGYGGAYAYKLFGSNLSEFYLRICIYGSAGVGAGYPGWSALGNILGYMRHDIYSRPTLYLNGSLAATGTTSISTAWNVYEWYVKIADAPNGRVIIKQNGLTEINFTGDTLFGYSYADALSIFCGTSESIQLDDLALNDTNGASDNSWCGDGHIERLNPDADGDVNNWMGNDGNKVNNWQLVDERPPNNDTDDVYSATPGEQDMYNVSDFDPTNKVVTRVWAECRARDANSLSGQIKLGFKTGGTVYLCSANRILPSVYTKIVGDDAVINPKTGVAWTEADLDAIQFVIECE